MFALSWPSDALVIPSHSPAQAVQLLTQFYTQHGATPLERLLVRHRAAVSPFHRIAAAIPPGSGALDLGCGRGVLLGYLALLGRIRRGAGCDPSARAIALAQRVAPEVARCSAVDLAFEQADLADYEPETPFDVVTLIDVMHHLPRRMRPLSIAKAASALRPGGLLVYKDMARAPFWKRLANRLHDLALAKQWIHEEPLENVKRWAAEAGLTLERQSSVHMLWYSHELCVFRKTAPPGSPAS